MKNYKSIAIGTKEECLNSEYSYALNISFEPTVKNLDALREAAKDCKLVFTRFEEPSESSSIFEKKNIEEAEIFNTLVFGDKELNNITFIIKFYKTQEVVSISGDLIKNIDIIVNIDSESSDYEITSSILSLNLDGAKETEERLGSERYKFKLPEETIIKESYQKYTSRVSQLMEDQSMVMLMGECGVSTSKKSWGFWIKDSEDISGFDKIGICIYSEDLCVLKYDSKTKEYIISSLTYSGPYGNKDYKSGYITIPNDAEYYGLCGPNIIYTTEDYYIIYSIYNLSENVTTGYKIDRVINNLPNFLITSPWVIYGSLKFSDSYAFFNKIKSISSLDILQERDEYLGAWEGKYKIKYGNGAETYYLGGVGYTIDNTDKISWINDNLMIYRSENKIALIPKLYDISRVLKDNNNLFIVNEEDYYDFYSIKVFDPFNDELDNNERILLDGLRRKPWRIRFPSLNSIIPFRGLIFYKENDKLLLY